MVAAIHTKFPNGVNAPFVHDVEIASDDGAISIKSGIVQITKVTAAALTLADPVADEDDGKILEIISETAVAHTVTIAGGLRGAGAGADVGTFGLAIGNGLRLYAYQGAWYPCLNGILNVTFA